MENESPFYDIPSGVGIAHYFMEELRAQRQGADGFPLWREGNDYCYLWVLSSIDLDYVETYLLDIRTNIGGTETRDFLKVEMIGIRIECEWHNEPIAFRAPWLEHEARMNRGLNWLRSSTWSALDRFHEHSPF
jgi:hypothetical protein